MKHSLKTTAASLLTAPLLLYATQASYCQEKKLTEEQSKDTPVVEQLDVKNKSAWGLLLDRAKNMVFSADGLWDQIETGLKKGVNTASEAYLELIVELALEKQMAFVISDENVRDYLTEHYGPHTLSAEVENFSENKSKAVITMKYQTSFEKSAIYKQYVIALEGKKPSRIDREGNSWAERYGSRLELNEFFDIVRFDQAYNKRWKQKKKNLKLENNGQTVKITRSPDAFQGIRTFTENDYNRFDNDVVFSSQLDRAQVGIKVSVLDEFGNKKDNSDTYLVEQYVKNKDTWTFDKIIYSASYHDGLLIGTEKNRFEKVPKAYSYLQKAKSAFGGLLDYLKK